MIVLTLPYPLSANRYWRKFPMGGKKGGREIVIRSKEADDYIERVGWLCRQAGIRKPLQWRVRVDIALYPARPQDWAKRAAADPVAWDDDVRCIDLDNARKVLNDALKGIVFDDDRWIWADSGQRMEPDGEARVVVTITPLQRPASPQGSLLEAAA
ncbi:MAG: RusA family crossover junction endodeoxyribonuclease [Rubrivivax sp.]|nr:RusA family crossover junction endodeoxyribonuclease [Rubrivivax sp.]